MSLDIPVQITNHTNGTELWLLWGGFYTEESSDTLLKSNQTIHDIITAKTSIGKLEQKSLKLMRYL